MLSLESDYNLKNMSRNNFALGRRTDEVQIFISPCCDYHSGADSACNSVFKILLVWFFGG